MIILGISDVTGNHSNGSIVVLENDKLVFALSQERISRIKNDAHFPAQAIEAALTRIGIRLRTIDCFACAYPPAHYYSSIFNAGKMDLPRSLIKILYHQPFALIKYLIPNIRKGFFDPRNANGLMQMGINKDRFRFIDHHHAHVAAAWALSNFEDCLGISYGGFAPHLSGENVAGAVYHCCGNQMHLLQDIPLPAAGCYYSGISVALGFKYMEQESLVTALSAYGDAMACFEEINLLSTRFKRDKWIPYRYWIDYIMSPRRQAFLATQSGRRLIWLCQKYGRENVAAAAQKVWEENNLNFIRYLCKKYHCHRFVLSGGVYNNILINERIREKIGPRNLFVHPLPGDVSTPIGATLEAHRQITGQIVRSNSQDFALGIEFMDNEIQSELEKYPGRITFSKIKDVSLQAARALHHGEVVAWFQGREEYGVAMQSHRCILADPRRTELRDRINRIKRRQSFIPIGVSCLHENGADYFRNFTYNAGITQAYQVFKAKFHLIQGAIHTNEIALVQSVTPESYEPFRKTVEFFYKLSNIPMILNSSLNISGQPIVHSLSEAVDLFMKTDLDKLFIGSYAVNKAIF
jgi:carbamoyltransferase